jgi:hypothetical protein
VNLRREVLPHNSGRRDGPTATRSRPESKTKSRAKAAPAARLQLLSDKTQDILNYFGQKKILFLPLAMTTDEKQPVEMSTPDGSLPGAAESSIGSSATADAVEGVVSNLKIWGWWVFEQLQVAGEIVASVIGLNDSKFQYVIDNMTEEDWKIARAHEARRLAAVSGRPYEEMEGGAGKHTSEEIMPPKPPTAAVEISDR